MRSRSRSRWILVVVVNKESRGFALEAPHDRRRLFPLQQVQSFRSRASGRDGEQARPHAAPLLAQGRDVVADDGGPPEHAHHGGNRLHFREREARRVPQQQAVWVVEPEPSVQGQARDRVPHHVSRPRDVVLVVQVGQPLRARVGTDPRRLHLPHSGPHGQTTAEDEHARPRGPPYGVHEPRKDFRSGQKRVEALGGRDEGGVEEVELEVPKPPHLDRGSDGVAHVVQRSWVRRVQSVVELAAKPGVDRRALGVSEDPVRVEFRELGVLVHGPGRQPHPRLEPAALNVHRELRHVCKAPFQSHPRHGFRHRVA
mmetsp:Transcript_62901/g.126110  ORF Transcript_62901/g.126110 Transcript_62901/m.126110 type:complete len:313 (-) Transcript_62901:524-1462(-)